VLTFLDQVTASVLETDVCIAGAGPAGITLALQMAELGLAVVLLEGGGLAPPTPEAKSLYAGQSSGREYPLETSRLRYFGGTTGHWGGWSRPLDDVDLAVKSHIEYSGWPIARAALDPWYVQAHQWLEIPDTEYFQHAEPPFSNRLLPSAHGVINRFFRFSPPTRYGTRYREEIKNAARVQCLLGANITSLQRHADHITGVTARSLQGKQIEVRARCTVLATGGIENARILLNSAERSEECLGNQGDWLGRGFMDHPGWSPGIVVSSKGLAYHRFTHHGEPIMPVLGIADDALLSEKLINCCGMLQPVNFDKDIQQDYFINPWFDGMARAGEASSYGLQLIFEPSPCRNSRVQLTDNVDSLGIRQPNLHWAFNESDFHMLARSIDHFIAFLGQSGMGRLKLHEPVNTVTTRRRFKNGMHHMGTTRMSADPMIGVVDRNCRVHGTNNLFVAGSSVFPSVGFSNPTLTIVALACRMASHINEELSTA